MTKAQMLNQSNFTTYADIKLHNSLHENNGNAIATTTLNDYNISSNILIESQQKIIFYLIL